ncbi:hydrolase [Bosea sp. Root483D1]|uniref:hydrolase n=1 Tax=Bosea sp. Root483D1 TaxID=1736544 RepID=UPI00070FC929|nr:hydrolase [Bosea sp. Root483D1]KRE20564.1 hydrolase [Bosea sp. Root483D1]
MTTLTLDPPQGRSALPFVDARHPQRPLEVNFYRPARHRPEDEVVFVQHGMLRNGDDYRDFWIDAAEKHNLLIVAPTFGNEHFPQAEGYNNGLLLSEDGAVAAKADWLYAVPARVLAALRKAGVTTRDKVKLFGHSAGGQFVHRLLATQSETPFETAFAANSGWYTLPTLERRFPEGLGGLGLGDTELARWLAWPMVIFAGDQDIVTSDPNLPAQAEALAQGPMRYARAHFMLDFAKAEAARLGLACNWSLITVPGIGHDGAAMSRAAASWWYEGRIPSAEELKPEATAVA